MTDSRFSFNLIDEPWIPCVLKDGTARDLSLRETLSRSAGIREISDPSPPVTVALHRLLLAILHRSLRGPANADDWAEIWRTGSWDTDRVVAYLDQWRHRFDLFDAEHPFYQNGNIGFDEAKPMAYMVHGMVVGNNATLFDHSVDSQPPAISPAAAARYLVALQGFALGGFVSSVKGEDRGKVGSADASPLSRGIVTLLTGKQLFETLLLNLHQYDAEAEEPFPFTNDDPNEDMPAWERFKPTEPIDRAPDGYVDLLTWQSRRARLRPEVEASGAIVVRYAAVMKGYQFIDGWRPWNQETMLAYREIKRPGDATPYAVISFNEARALWRDSDALLGALAGNIRPGTIKWLGTLTLNGYLPRSARYQISALGVLSDRKSIEFWRTEQLPLPASLLDDANLLARIEQALTLAERVGRLFNRGFDDGKDAKGKKITIPRPMQTFAATLLAPGDDRSADPKDIANLVEALEPAAGYWPQLDAPFKQFILDLPGDGGVESFPGWIKTVERAARATFDEVMLSFDTSARALKAAASAQRRFNMSLAAIVGSYRPGREEEIDAQAIASPA